MKLVSIGMPVFNDKHFLSKSIESIINQSYNNFELILSDDCSSDGSAQICEKFVRKDKRIKYIKQEKNIGISRNMEFLLRQATGEYFMWAGNDDLWHSDFILLHVNALESSPIAISAFCPYHFIDEDDKILQYPPPRNCSYESRFSSIRLLKLTYFWDDGFGYGMFRREKIQTVKFPVCWWINKKRAYNNIYPTLFYYLSLGEYKHIDGVPLWYNRLKNNWNINHKIPYPESFLKGFLSFCLWKLNVYAKCTQSVLLSKQPLSILCLLFVLPCFIFKWMVDTAHCLKSDLFALIKNRKQFF